MQALHARWGRRGWRLRGASLGEAQGVRAAAQGCVRAVSVAARSGLREVVGAARPRWHTPRLGPRRGLGPATPHVTTCTHKCPVLDSDPTLCVVALRPSPSLRDFGVHTAPPPSATPSRRPAVPPPSLLQPMSGMLPPPPTTPAAAAGSSLGRYGHPASSHASWPPTSAAVSPPACC